MGKSASRCELECCGSSKEEVMVIWSVGSDCVEKRYNYGLVLKLIGFVMRNKEKGRGQDDSKIFTLRN